MDHEQIAKLLKKACWSSAGWKKQLDLTAEELASLEAEGFAPASRKMSHDQCVAWGIAASKAVSRDRVVRAFVWSLSARRYEYRSALGSYAFLHRLPDHPFVRAPGYSTAQCATCGSEEMIRVDQKRCIASNFARQRWGGVGHGLLSFAPYDLEMFAGLPEVCPTDDDWQALRAILRTATDDVTGKNVTSLKKAIRSIIGGTKEQADVLCHILAFAGILATDTNRGFDRQFVSFVDQNDDRPKSDQAYPLNCWAGPGVRNDAVTYWFPDLAW